MTKPTLDQLTSALHLSWDGDTCSDATEWSSGNPARGQCVATSLVVQDYYGGGLLRYEVQGQGIRETHYCNILDDGTILDTTGQQYRQPVTLHPLPVSLTGFTSVREKRLADAVTRERYELLKGRVALKLEGIA
jgi:hypothetical protein